jgi:hypothetical protein
MRALHRLLLVAATSAIIAVALSPAAEARRFRLRLGHIGSFGEQAIEKVYDLPDRAPFTKDDNFVDLGKRGQLYVLYYDNYYHVLTEDEIAMVARELGFDPVAKDRAAFIALQQATSDAKQAKLQASGKGVDRKYGESVADFEVRKQAFLKKIQQERSSRSSSTIVAAAPAEEPAQSGGTSTATLIGLSVMMIGALAAFKNRQKIAQAFASDNETTHEIDVDSFDRRVREQLVEVERRQQTPSAPPARGFGRKGVQA